MVLLNVQVTPRFSGQRSSLSSSRSSSVVRDIVASDWYSWILATGWHLTPRCLQTASNVQPRPDSPSKTARWVCFSFVFSLCVSRSNQHQLDPLHCLFSLSLWLTLLPSKHVSLVCLHASKALKYTCRRHAQDYTLCILSVGFSQTIFSWLFSHFVTFFLSVSASFSHIRKPKLMQLATIMQKKQKKREGGREKYGDRWLKTLVNLLAA